MPKLKHKLPNYSLHKASGQAVVKIDGRSHYLGKYGSPQSHAAYRKVTAEWAANNGPIPTPEKAPAEIQADLRVSELLVAYLDLAEGYYYSDTEQLNTNGPSVV